MSGVVIAIIVIAVLVVLAGALFWSRKQKSSKLQQRFGPEYERTVSESGKRSEAERQLSEREKRVEKLRIKELESDQKTKFGQEWQNVQARFVDDPSKAITEADGLVQQVMDARGYPISDFEQQAADISVDHPEVVKNYRAAHEIAEKNEKDGASTEDLRQAMIHYRALFSELLGATPVAR